MGLTYDEIVYILGVKYIAGSASGHTLPPRIYEISDFKYALKSLLSKRVKVKITIDDIRLKSNTATKKKTKKSTKKLFSIQH